MSETKHSPLPWKQDGVSVLDAKGHEVAETWGNQFAKMVLPDAAFIVTAVNAHDKLTADRASLIEALESIRLYANDTLSGRADGGPDDREWQRKAVLEIRNRARTAIAQAKEQP